MACGAKHMSSVERRRKKGWSWENEIWHLVISWFSVPGPSRDIYCNNQSTHSPLLLLLMSYSCFCFAPFLSFAAGLQAILPEYLKARFVQAALSYIGCNEEGQFVCKDNDCWCHCAAEYPQCNCPEVDLRAMEASLLKIRDSWNAANRDFEESGQCFLPLCTRSVTVTLLLIAN